MGGLVDGPPPAIAALIDAGVLRRLEDGRWITCIIDNDLFGPREDPGLISGDPLPDAVAALLDQPAASCATCVHWDGPGQPGSGWTGGYCDRFNADSSRTPVWIHIENEGDDSHATARMYTAASFGCTEWSGEAKPDA